MQKKHRKSKRMRGRMQFEWQTMVLPGVIFLAIFNYWPMFGIITAFQDFSFSDGFFGSPWATTEGVLDIWKNFRVFFEDPMFFTALKNTVCINLIGLALFPLPIILALLFNELPKKNLAGKTFSKVVQTISYLPNFISWIVYGSMVISLLDPNTGVINLFLKALGLTKEGIDFINETEYSYFIVTLSSQLKGVGWGTVIYMASITGVDVSLLEYAEMEGANRFQKIWYVYFPQMKPLISLYFIMGLPGIFNSNFDQMYILGNNLNSDKTSVLATYVYNVAFGENNVSKATAIGLIQSVIGAILVLGGNEVSKKVSGRSVY